MMAWYRQAHFKARADHSAMHIGQNEMQIDTNDTNDILNVQNDLRNSCT